MYKTLWYIGIIDIYVGIKIYSHYVLSCHPFVESQVAMLIVAMKAVLHDGVNAKYMALLRTYDKA